MTFEQRHYAQLLLLEKLADDATPRQGRIARKLRAGLLMAMGIACLVVSGWLVVAQSSALAAVMLGGISGALLAGGLIAMVGDGDESDGWSDECA